MYKDGLDSGTINILVRMHRQHHKEVTTSSVNCCFPKSGSGLVVGNMAAIGRMSLEKEAYIRAAIKKATGRELTVKFPLVMDAMDSIDLCTGD